MMTPFWFDTDPDKIATKLEKIRRFLCQYNLGSKANVRCDCKFMREDARTLNEGEACGCPELYEAIAYLKNEARRIEQTETKQLQLFEQPRWGGFVFP